MKNLSVVFFALLVFVLSSCEIDEIFNDNCLEEGGLIETIELDFVEFDAIDLEIPAKMTLVQGEEQKVEIRTSTNIINEIERSSRVAGKTLQLTVDERCIRTNRGIEIFITMATLQSIHIDGAGEAITTGVFADLQDLNLSADGAAEFNIAFEEVETLDIDSDGAAEFTIAGNAIDTKMNIQGASEIKAFDLLSKNCTIDAAGAVEGEINVEENLTVVLSGAGEICYKGNPTITSDISGVGSLNDCN